MIKNIKYLVLTAFSTLLFYYSCEKDTNDIFKNKELVANRQEKNGTEKEDIPSQESSESKMGIRLPDFPGEARKYAVSLSTGTKIFMGFGFGDSGPVYDFWEWNFDIDFADWDLSSNNSWSKLPEFPGLVPKTGITEAIPMGFVANGKCYILPGAFKSNGKLVNEFWEFDPESKVWTRKADPPATLARYFAAGFSIRSKIYIGTGETYDGQWKLYNDFWEWNQTTDTWTKKADFPGEKRAHATGFSVGNKGYLGLGGQIGMGGGPVYQDFWEYDQATDKWTRKADFKGNQTIDAIGFSANDKGYLTAGWDPIIDSTAPQEIWSWNQTKNFWTKIGIFSGHARASAVGGSIGNFGYLLSGQNLTKEWEKLPILNDFWIFDFTSY